MQHFKHLKSQSGSAALILAMAIATGMGATLYYAVDQTVLKQRDEKSLSARERSAQVNVSSLAQLTALMAYTKPNPAADDATALPYIFPDPYLNSSSFGAIRNPPTTASSWQFSAPNLNLYASRSASLQAADFKKYVTEGRRPGLGQQATVTFVAPIMDTAHPKWIRAYRAEVTTTTAGSTAVSTIATVPVPRMPPPKCTITAQNGQKLFQPDNMISLTIAVSGVALNALVPTTTQQLVNGSMYRDYTGYKMVDTSAKSTSIRNTTPKNVFSWSVPAPRPLTAVDGSGTVPFTITAFVKAADDTGTQKCTLDILVSAPATCKLWTSAASVPPGSCSDIRYGTIGSVVRGSLALTATDLGGKDYTSNISKISASTYRFCTPALPSAGSSDTSAIPKRTLDLYKSTLKSFSVGELSAVGTAMRQQMSVLNETFPSKSPLRTLTIDQVLALLDLSPSQLSILSELKFSKISGLRDLSKDQEDALHSTDADTLSKLYAVDLPSIRILENISSKTLAALSGFDPSSLATYTNAAIQAKAAPTDYVVRGSVKDNYGSTNSCITHITAGTNPCPFFGASYPKYGKDLTLLVNYYGDVHRDKFTFKPGAPSWEVEAVANSPYDVTSCPADARCFAVDFGTARTPFVTVQPANSAQCTATVSDRINLGCFAYHTKIRMADGSDREISQINRGDLVLNPMNKRAMKVKRTTSGPEKEALVVLTAGSLQVKVTTKHPMITPHGVVTAISLHAGDEIMNQNGAWQRIDKVTREVATLSVMNIELDTASTAPEDHALLADGLITGDLYLQEHMPGNRSVLLPLPMLSTQFNPESSL